MQKQVYLCYGDHSEDAAHVRDAFKKSEVKYFDCEYDIAVNRQPLPLMNKLISKADWVVFLWESQQTVSEIVAYQKDMAVDCAINKKRRNIIIICHENTITALPDDLVQFPCIVFENRDWVDELLNIVARNSESIEKGNRCKNKNHVDVEKELHRTGFKCISEPEYFPGSDDDRHHSAIPYSQKRKLNAKAKSRNRQAYGISVIPSRLLRLSRQAQKKNWFYKQYMKHVAHSESCVCYFFQVCNMTSLITNIYFLFWILRASFTESMLNTETVIFYILSLFLHLCPLILFWNCSDLCCKLRVFKHYRNILTCQLPEILLFGNTCYNILGVHVDILVMASFPNTVDQFSRCFLVKQAECAAQMTFFHSVSNRRKSSKYVEIALNGMVAILLSEMIYTKQRVLHEEWSWLFDDINFLSPVATLTVILLCVLCWLYVVNGFVRDIYNDTALPNCLPKCSRSQHWLWHMNAALGFLLYSYYTYLSIRDRKKSVATFRQTQNLEIQLNKTLPFLKYLKEEHKHQ